MSWDISFFCIERCFSADTKRHVLIPKRNDARFPMIRDLLRTLPFFINLLQIEVWLAILMQPCCSFRGSFFLHLFKCLFPWFSFLICNLLECQFFFQGFPCSLCFKWFFTVPLIKSCLISWSALIRLPRCSSRLYRHFDTARCVSL